MFRISAKTLCRKIVRVGKNFGGCTFSVEINKCRSFSSVTNMRKIHKIPREHFDTKHIFEGDFKKDWVCGSKIEDIKEFLLF
jgi:hypothetical protein